MTEAGEGRRGQGRASFPFWRPLDLLLPLLLLLALLAFRPSARTCSELELLIRGPQGEIRIPLPADTVLTVQGELGGLLVEVSGDSARVVDSPCRGKQCVRAGWLGSAGEMSVCMPSGVFLLLRATELPEPDAVSY